MQELRAGTKAKTMNESCLLACSPQLNQPAVLTLSRTICPWMLFITAIEEQTKTGTWQILELEERNRSVVGFFELPVPKS